MASPGKHHDSAMWRARRRVHSVLKAPAFEYALTCLILVNSITIGIEVSQDEPSDLLSWMEGVFLGVFIIEICTRLFAYHWANFKNNWFLFDLACVTSSVISTAV